jgi:hypothetical protein
MVSCGNDKADNQVGGALFSKMYVLACIMLISGGHCRAFAPTWTKLARDKQHLERLAGFHMAQVNCLAQGGGLFGRCS